MDEQERLTQVRIERHERRKKMSENRLLVELIEAIEAFSANLGKYGFSITEGLAAIAAPLSILAQPPTSPGPQPLLEIKFMFIVKDNNPDVTFSLDLGDVTDAEGNVIPDAQLELTVESDNATAVAVTFDPVAKTGTASFGSPGQANVTANVKSNGVLLGTGAAGFTVTAGDPAAITSVKLTFNGLTEAPTA